MPESYDPIQIDISIVESTIKMYKKRLGRRIADNVKMDVTAMLAREEERLAELKIKHPEYFI